MVRHLSRWRKPDLPALFLDSITPIDFFKKHKEALVEHSDFFDHPPSKKQTSAFRLIDLAFVVMIPIEHFVLTKLGLIGEELAQSQKLIKHAKKSWKLAARALNGAARLKQLRCDDTRFGMRLHKPEKSFNRARMNNR